MTNTPFSESHSSIVHVGASKAADFACPMRWCTDSTINEFLKLLTLPIDPDAAVQAPRARIAAAEKPERSRAPEDRRTFSIVDRRRNSSAIAKL
jgi:hypothetical protein